MSKLYGRPPSARLDWHETIALAHLRRACPAGQPQDKEIPVPGKPGHYYPPGTKERLENKGRRPRGLAPI